MSEWLAAFESVRAYLGQMGSITYYIICLALIEGVLRLRRSTFRRSSRELLISLLIMALAIVPFIEFAGWFGRVSYGLVSRPVFQVFSFSGAFVLQLLVYDFVYYWSHRLNHTISFLWRFHQVHHSATEMNALVAFRNSPLVFFNSFWFLWLPLFWLGYPLEIFALLGSISLAWDACHHCQWIRLPAWTGQFIMRPAHHALHHFDQYEFQTANYGRFFSIWDRVFGTYRAPELVSPDAQVEKFGLGRSVSRLHGIFGDLRPVSSEASIKNLE